MELKTIQNVYFIGIGGIGMSAIARYFLNRGCTVCGYDKTSTNMTIALENEGISLNYEDDKLAVPAGFLNATEKNLIVYTPAIPKTSEIAGHFRDKGVKMWKRSEVLGIISKGQFCIAVAGTHGKTTTSSIIAHILTDTGYGCTAFLGGIATNYNSNFLIGNNNVVVVEADEYDRSFLTLHPDISVITSMDADHLDIYGDAEHLNESFRLFASQLKSGGALFIKEGLPLEGINYGVGGKSQVSGQNIRIEGSNFLFDYIDDKVRIDGIQLMLPGRHNVENAIAAVAVAVRLGINTDKIKQAVANFKGVKRRFEYIVKTDQHIYIDDYAHHPTELEACFHAVRQLYPDRKLTVIFQPHLFSRTKDFADDFAAVLSKVDELMLLEIYPARELPIPGIDAQFLLGKIKLEKKQIFEKEAALKKIQMNKPGLLLTVGAGDIDTLIQPLKTLLTDA
jgi:UDP-N-acetylmuramate--alanine ligase